MGKISISFQVKTIWEEAQMRMEVIWQGKKTQLISSNVKNPSDCSKIRITSQV